MINIKLSKHQALNNVIMPLVRRYKPEIVEDLYRELYEEYLDAGYFDNVKEEFSSFIENDLQYIGYVYKQCEGQEFEKIKAAYEEHGNDISPADIGYNYVEIMRYYACLIRY